MKEVLIEQEVGVARSVVQHVPSDRADNTEQCVERGGESSDRVSGEDIQRLAHQRVLLAQLRGDTVHGLALEGDLLHPSEQKGEHHGLTVLFDELGVGRLREQQVPPVLGQFCKGWQTASALFLRDRLTDLFRQELAEVGDCSDELARGARRLRLPGQEVVQHPRKRPVGGSKPGAGCEDRATQAGHFANLLALLVDREFVPVTEQYVVEQPQFRKLFGVAACVDGRVGLGARLLELDVTDECAADLHRIVGAGSHVD
ncbi:hypothetical protein [Streptomyces sp. NPDC057889]|uniref:hypothetical protein n=1 Tax=unclassified Streptomyces TaxID=2593676 RepID=UPI00368B7478